MPTISRRKTKHAKKKTKPLNLPNQHSSATVQLQTKGPFVSENRSEMEGNFNGTYDMQKVEEESSSEDKEVAVEVSDEDVYDGKSKSVSGEHVESCKVVKENEDDVSETVYESLESSDAVEADRVEDIEDSKTVELEFKEEKGKDFVSLEDDDDDDDVVEETELVTSKANDEGSRESEVVETVRDVTVGEDENVLSSLPSVDVVSVSRESDDVEQLDVQESSSVYESAKESFLPSSNVPDSDNNSVNEQDKVEGSTGIENQGSIFSVTQRQPSSWKNCCGLLEVLRHGDR